MSNLAVLVFASCSLLAAQSQPGESKTNNLPASQKTEKRVIVGNEKTVGASNGSNHKGFRTVDDRNTVGNAKTVGGDQHHVYHQERKSLGMVGNSATVGGS